MTPAAGRPTSVAAWGDALWTLLMALAIAAGLALAWHGAPTIDDAMEMRTLDLNADAAAEAFGEDRGARAALERYQDRYYGVGFYAVSWPLRAALASVHAASQGWTPDDSRIAAQHVATFLFHLLGVYAFFRLMRLGGATPRFAAWASLFLLANPYLLGHASMNAKDAPFMSAWLLCLWRLAAPCASFLRSGTWWRRDFIVLGACIALLLSIRISGLLFAIPLLLAAAWLEKTAAESLARERGALLRGVAWGAATALVLAWLAYPVLWFAPWRVLDAVQSMSRHAWDGCSTTWGDCLRGRDLPWHYLASWMIVKVSVIALAALPLAFVLLARRGTAPLLRGLLVVSLGSVLVIVLLLVLRGATLYNELRQVLFLVPMLYLAAFLALSQWPGVGRVALALGLAVGAADLALLWPYPYAWFNEATRFAGIDGRFQTDYWRLASRELGPHLQAAPPGTPCVYAQLAAQLEPYVRGTGACVVSHGLAPPPGLAHRPFFMLPGPDLEPWAIANGCEPVYRIRRALLGVPPFELLTLHLCR